MRLVYFKYYLCCGYIYYKFYILYKIKHWFKRIWVMSLLLTYVASDDIKNSNL